MNLKIDKEKIQLLIKPIIDKLNLQIYEINMLKEFDKNVLQILLQHDENHPTVNFDLLIKANEEISLILDDNEDLCSEYILEVASAGLERRIHSKEQLINQISNYLYMEIKKENFYHNVTLESYENNEFMFSYLVKGVNKKIKCKFEDINFIRFAVKF
ncbi:hypothetical protein [Spiroplasma endosymbiont of Aspidapion aeneum]|uniref:hypothetical protein n=1 Tax=Spiroplasma endosymbiont of Aspidapion aeneum TaxID=3066276 RepID=UPI00313B0502